MEKPTESKIGGIEEKENSSFLVYYHDEPLCEEPTWKEAAFARMVAEKAEHFDAIQKGEMDEDGEYYLPGDDEEDDDDDEEDSDEDSC